MKILHTVYVSFHLACHARLALQTENIVEKRGAAEKHATKVTKKPKMKLPKYVMSWA